jgi:hypothetical protein
MEGVRIEGIVGGGKDMEYSLDNLQTTGSLENLGDDVNLPGDNIDTTVKNTRHFN